MTQRLHELAVSDTGFVFDPMSGATFSVNGTGLVLLSALKRGLGRAALTQALRDAFDVGARDLRRDVDEFVARLREADLLSRDFRLED